jgi:hypothetical protein
MINLGVGGGDGTYLNWASERVSVSPNRRIGQDTLGFDLLAAPLGTI